MHYKTPAAFIITLLVIVAILHFAGIYLHWYWRIWWFNRIVHFLAGFLVAFITLFVFHSYWAIKKWPLFILAIGSSLIIGIVWELFQLKYGITIWGGPGYAFDTISDISADVLGGLFGFFYFISKYQTGLLWSRE